MERTDSEQIENHLVASQTASGLSTWSGKLASLSVLGPEAAEAAVRVAREKSNFDLGFPKTPETVLVSMASWQCPWLPG